MTTIPTLSSDLIREVRAGLFTKSVVSDTWKPLWTPLAHQVPPAGVPGVDWNMWLLLGGRGAGKTDAGAHYVNEHAMGPPCDSRIPGGHRISIIAPTKGDAVESCVNGPSGLKAHNPDVKLVSRAGGTFAIWPNGAEAKIFGAFKPEDVERLRAGGNRCLAAGTLVATANGPVAIEHVTPGMLVYTRNGLRRVLRAGQTGIRECIEVTDGVLSVRCTPDHLIWAGHEWKRADLVTRIVTWDNHLLCGTGFDGINEKTATSQVVDEDSCTEPSMPMHMGRSPRVFTSIILTTTRPITRLTTWWPKRRQLIGLNTKKSEELTGTVKGAQRLMLPVLWLSTNANFAVGRIRRFFLRANIAQNDVETKEPRHERSAKGCAWCAVHGSKPLNGDRPVLAATTVERSISRTSSEPEPVYDLLVEHDHEFFANGILVANCLAWVEELAAWPQLVKAWPHMKFGLRIGPHPHVIGSTTPRPRKFFVKLTELPKTATTHATTDDNPHLAEEVRQDLYATYDGTSLGAQELRGKIVSEVKGAITNLDALDAVRVWEHPKLSRRIVMVDPAVTYTEDSDETGITVQGRAGDHVYLLADTSLKAPVDTKQGWAYKAVETAVEWECGAIWYEATQGSDTNKVVLKSALKEYNEEHGTNHSIIIEGLPASLSKYDRALPLQQAISQGKWHPVGVFEKLEDQLTTWTPEGEADDETDDKKSKKDKSPDRMDAAVHGFRKLMGIGGKGRTGASQLQAAKLPG